MIKFQFDEISIVKGGRADGPELTAAGSIQERFARESRARVPIVSESEKHLFRKKFVVIGTPDTCDMLRKMEKPKHDGYLIDVKPEKIIFLGGMPRGVLYAVDQFLKSIKISGGGFTVEEGSMLEEPSFQKRFIIDYGLLNPKFQIMDPELMRRYRINSCLMGVYASDGVLLKDSFPEIYRMMKDKNNAERCKLRELDRAKKLEEIRSRYGIDNYVYVPFGLPDNLRDAIYKIYPDIKGVPHQNSYEKAHMCPSNPMSWKIWHAIVEDVLEIYPGAEGVYLDIMHNGYGIYCQCEKCRANGLNDFPAELRKAVLETYKILKKHGKKLLYHTWTTNSKPRKGRSQGSDSGVPWLLPGDRPEWVFRQVVEWTPSEVELVKMDTWGDVLPTAPMDPLIGKTGKHPQIVQFQTAAEYRGFNKVPNSMVQYLKDRMGICSQLNVSGVLAIIGGWMDPYYLFWKDIINSVNFEAFAMLAWNVEEDVDKIWSSWAEKIYGSKAAPQVIAALKMSQSVIEKALAIRGINFTDHSGYPTSIPRAWEISWDWSNYWYPDSHERFAITPENIEKIIREKEGALKSVRKMLHIINKAKPHLQKEQYRELHERTEWLLHYVTIQRYLAEIYFRMLYLEEQVKKGKTDAGQIDQIDKAYAKIVNAHTKLPESAKMESYYMKFPEKRTPGYPIYPWLPAHSSGHPVKFANMMREHAANISHEILTWRKTN